MKLEFDEHVVDIVMWVCVTIIVVTALTCCAQCAGYVRIRSSEVQTEKPQPQRAP